MVVSACGVKYDELALVSSITGNSLAQVIRIDGEKVYLQVFARSSGISTSDEVRFLGHPMEVSFSENLLGRIFDGTGTPRDRGPSLSEILIRMLRLSLFFSRRESFW